MELTIEKIRGSVSYDPVTGIFTWTRDILSGKNNAFVNGRKGEKAGFIAGNHADGYGYEYISIDGRRYSSHRLAWFYMTGSFPSKSYDIDHINGIRSDNRWSNLRLVSRSINMQNLKKAHKDNSTGMLGVEKKRNKFSAHICINRKRFCLGTFGTPLEAHMAYLEAKRKLHEGNTL